MKETAKERGGEGLPRLWNRDYRIAMAGNFMLFFSFYLLTPLLPIYLDAQFAADKDMIGLVYFEMPCYCGIKDRQVPP